MGIKICRCAAYSNIVDAITEVGGERRVLERELLNTARDRLPRQRRLLSAWPGFRFVAGETDLLDLMKLEIETPRHLIDVNGLALDKIESTAEGGLRIGALVRNTDLAADERVRRDYGLLSRALLRAGASGQLRNKATTAGNLLQRTRCALFLRHQSAMEQT